MKSGKTTSVLAIGVAVLLAACSGGGGGGGSTAPTATTAQAKGSVNAGEIGGTGLNVLSAQQAATADVKNGSFTTTVSTQGPQLLFLQDSVGKIRGLTLSLPSNSSTASIMAADATSTALALLFLSPGVTTSNSAQAKQVFTALQQMTSFAPFLAFLQANLPARALDELVQDATYGTLLMACLTEWPGVAATLPPVPVASLSPLAFAVDPKVTPPSAGGFPQIGGVSVTADPSTQSAENVPVTIQNYGWRYIKMYKAAYDSNGAFLPASSESLSYQGGAAILSTGGILFGTSGTPSFSVNKANFTNGVDKFVYWVVGPGRGACPDCPIVAEAGHGAEGANADDDELLSLTYRDYLFIPMLSLLTGQGSELASALKNIVTSKTLANQLQAFKSAFWDPTSSVSDVAGAFLKIVVTLAPSVTKDLISNGIIPAAADVFTPLGKILAIANMSTAANWYFTTPHVAKVEITAPYDKLEFSLADYTVTKTANQAIITITRTGGSKDTLTVKYAVSDDTAIAGQDYTATSGTLTFVPNDTKMTFPIPLKNNPANTGSRKAKLALTLNDPSDGAKLGTINTATLTIKANADCAAGPVFNVQACIDIQPIGYWQDPIKSLTMPLALPADRYMNVGEFATQCCGAANVLFFSYGNYPNVTYVEFSVDILGYSGSGIYPIKAYPQAVPGGPYAAVFQSLESPNGLHFDSNHCLGGSVTVTETRDPNGARSFHVDVSLTGCVSLDSGSHEAGGIVGPITASFTTTPTMTFEELLAIYVNNAPSPQP